MLASLFVGDFGNCDIVTTHTCFCFAVRDPKFLWLGSDGIQKYM